jgi:hypothetical protein
MDDDDFIDGFIVGSLVSDLVSANNSRKPDDETASVILVTFFVFVLIGVIIWAVWG